MSKKIFLIALIFSIAGIFAEFMAVMPLGNFNGLGLRSASELLKTSNFDLPRVNFDYQTSGSFFRLNFINVVFYLLLLTSAFLYRKSSGREMRLLRCMMSIILLSSVLSLVVSLLMPLMYKELLEQGIVWWIVFFFGLGLNVFIFFITRSALIELTATRELDLSNTTAEASALSTSMVDSSGFSRFQHAIFDSIICIIIFFPVALSFPFMRTLEEAAGERGSIYIFFAVSRIIYYIFFEIMLSASPAKFLTESRVVDDDGIKPTASSIVGRTFSRLIPFDGLSFLGNGRWHDNISYTRVVDEKTTGVIGGYYYLIFPIVLVLGFMFKAGLGAYQDYSYRQKNLRDHKEKIDIIEKELARLSTDHIIKIKDYADVNTYLKIEALEGDEMIVSVIKKEYESFDSWPEIELAYQNQKADSSIFTIRLPQSSLKQAYTADYDNYNNNQRNKYPFFGDDKSYEIEKIGRFYRPEIQSGSGTYMRDGHINMGFINMGWPARVTNVEILEGSLTWSGLLTHAPSASTSFESFLIGFNDFKIGQFYKFKMTITDDKGRNEYYLVEGRNYDEKITLTD